MNKNRLLKEVQGHLAEYPGDSREFLDAVSEGLKGFEDSQREKRSGLALNAVRDLCGLLSRSKIPKYVTVAYVIDVAYHQFPKGPTGHSQVEQVFWDKFLALAKSEGDVDRHWLRDVKGPEYEGWWDLVVIPSMEVLNS